MDKGTVDAIYLSAGDRHAEDIGDIVKGVAKRTPPGAVFVVLSLTNPRYLWPLLFDAVPDAWNKGTSEVRKLPLIFMYILRRAAKRRHAADSPP